jgi:superfamily II RNA helicase
LHEEVSKLIHAGRAPIYLVSFTQRECAEEAQNFLSIDLCTKEEKKAIAEALAGFKFSSPYGKELQKFLRHGMGIHHAGLLPKYRVLIEKLAQKGLLKIIFGTDTLGVGVNVPIRTVLLTKLCKFDGQKTSILSVRDFQQICGRAGRKGFDDLGTVVIQAPEHVIENIRNEKKATGDPKKLKKLVKKKPPEKGFVPWNKETFQKLVDGKPEALVSRFKVTHSMLLNVLGRPDEDGCEAMRSLIRECHEPENSKQRLRKTAFQLFRSLVERKIIELDPLRVNVDLQEDFSLNHALSLYLVDTVKVLDPLDATYAMNVLTLVESILENPDLILRKQLDALKTIKMRELKEQGMEFDERLEELEKLEYPKPNREFIYDTFNRFAAAHPWIGQENIRPKSIAREMFEGFFSFAEYVREYDLQRAEGLLLRYLADVYKALVQNVPGYAKDDELYAVSVYFSSMIRQIDSSLIDEWERMRDPSYASRKIEMESGAGSSDVGRLSVPDDVTADRKAFTIWVRNEVFRVVKALAAGDFEAMADLLERDESFPSEQGIEVALQAYRDAGHARISTDQKARGPGHFRIEQEDGDVWRVQQTLVDPDELNDWAIDLAVDLARSRTTGKPVLKFIQMAPL